MSARARSFRALSVLAGVLGVLAFATAGQAAPTTAPATSRPEVYSAWPFSAEEAVKRQDATAKALGQPKEMTLELGNKVTMNLILIPAGKFMMGSPDSEKDRSENEGPQHEVTISKPFYMGIYTVTQEQYEKVMGKNPSGFKDGQNPVEMVAWEDAVEFCKNASENTGKKIRLPTEAEWEYACRAGNKTRFDLGDNVTALSDHAWYDGNSQRKTHPVGQKKANAWGLYDMHGNVWEWCSDYYADSYANAKDKDPQGPASGKYRVLRGGGWGLGPHLCRSATRLGSPGNQYYYCGFRVAVELK